MSENIYAAPLADLDEQIETRSDNSFYVVSVRKMLILFVMTLGFYVPYWFYENWSRYRDTSGDSLWPLPRAIFSVFFTHNLFRKIASHDTAGNRRSWDSDGIATALVILMIVGRILDKMSAKGVGAPLSDILSLLIMIPIAMLLRRVQTEINARCGDPSGSSNSKFSTANIIWCVVGGIVWLLAIIGLFVDA